MVWWQKQHEKTTRKNNREQTTGSPVKITYDHSQRKLMESVTTENETDLSE